MKKVLQISFILIACMVFFPSMAAAQGKKPKKEEYKVVEHLWYGFNIGGIGISSNSFSAGVAPMGGYKFNESLAVGAIAKLNYTYLWQRLGDNFHFFDYGAGVLGKWKFLKGKYFAQVEYDWMSVSNWNGVQQYRNTYPFFYIGGGMKYPGNEKWSSELVFLYNLHPESNQLFFPLTISYAFLYNF